MSSLCPRAGALLAGAPARANENGHVLRTCAHPDDLPFSNHREQGFEKPASLEDGLPFAFDIAVGVRKHDRTLRDRLDQVLAGRKDGIDRILAEYHVPRVGETSAAGSGK
jgi:hypothetical protein